MGPGRLAQTLRHANPGGRDHERPSAGRGWLRAAVEAAAQKSPEESVPPAVLTGARRHVLVGVAPHQAASTMASVAAWRIVTVPGATQSIMAGLSCGRPSAPWPTVRGTYDAFISVRGEPARLRTLKRHGVRGGECPGATLGALLQVTQEGRGLLPLSSRAKVLAAMTRRGHRSGQLRAASRARLKRL